jgi:fibronectin-binding autotransporter adhesin
MRFECVSLKIACCLVVVLLESPSQAQTLTWDANTATAGAQDGAGSWNTSNTNWLSGGANTSFVNGNNVIFGSGTGAGTAGTIDVDAGGVTAGAISLSAPGSGNYTFTGGSIIGGALTKTGNHIVTFNNGANTFSSVAINGGRLAVQGTGTLGTGTLTVGATAASSATEGGLGGSGVNGSFLHINKTGLQSFSNNIVLNNDSSTTYRKIAVQGSGGTTYGANNYNFSGTISGGGTGTTLYLDVATAGDAYSTFQLSGANTFTGTVEFNRGSLQLDSNASLGASSNQLIADGFSASRVTFNYTGNNTHGVTINTNTSFAVNGTNTINSSGAFNGGATFTKIGTGTLNLNAASTRTSASTISAGTLGLGNLSGLGTGAITIAPTATLSTAALNTSTTVANAINLSTGTGTRTLLMNGATASNVATYSGEISGGATGSTLFLNNGTSGSFAPQFALTNAGNTFTANININRGGLRITSNEALGNTANTVTFNSNPGADLTFLNSMTYTRNTTLSTATDFDTGANNVTASGTISGGSGLTKIGSGTLTLTGSNTFAGGTNVNAGSLQLGNGGTAGSLSTGSAISVGTGATFTINQSDTVIQGTDFSSAAISGNGGFTQAGTGTTVLNANNTYTGATNVTAGTLTVNGSLASSAVSVASGATLNGNGTISGATTIDGTLAGTGTFTGAVTINGFHSVGDSPGLQTFNDLTYTNGSVFNWELIDNSVANRGISFDAVNGTGDLLFTGIPTSNLLFAGDVDWTSSFWSTNQTWTVLSGFNSVTGAPFTISSIGADKNGLAFGGGNTVGSTFSWNASGNDLLLNYAVAVPNLRHSQ